MQHEINHNYLIHVWYVTIRIFNITHLWEHYSAKNCHSKRSKSITFLIFFSFVAIPHEPPLTHWGRVTHICVSKLTNTGSDNGLTVGRHQAIMWTNAGILIIGHLGTNLSEILIKIYTLSFKKIHLQMSSGKWRPSCLGLSLRSVIMWYYI